MPSIDLQYVRSRQRGIRRAVERSSPVLIYSGPVGIILIAANKSESRNRVGKVLDRMACVSRGDFTASQIAHRQAAQSAYAIADMLSRGEETLIFDAALQSVSTLLAGRYHTIIAEPLAVETVVVQLREAPEQDYMAHISPDGSTQLFERIRYFGPTESNGNQEESATTLKQLNAKLHELWAPYPSATELIMGLNNVDELAQLFSGGRRRDVVHLDRSSLAVGDYENIFKRLTF